MPGCILRVVSSSTDVESLIKASGLRPYKVYREGEPLVPVRKLVNKYSGFNIHVSIADGSSLDRQVRDAIRFLKRHSAGLGRLKRHRKFEEMTLDFGLWRGTDETEPLARFCRLPAILIELAGRHGIALELSFYGSNKKRQG